ncbi:enoyl-CoA hydratase-related protein [Pontibacter sp. JAM-7]|uniref:enoyl-CoA hydratase-related protein n=1 Tax=Pontibacter sp. JAM-7 TaxID=3366581 RepID=UPI003AF988CF
MNHLVECTQHHNGLAILRLNRPGKRNALTGSMIRQLLCWIEQLATDPTVRILQLEGSGDWFCSGVDLKWMLKMAQADAEHNLADAKHLALLLDRLWHFPHPTLCKVQGGAIGGGLGLAACCDLLLATRNSRFSCSEVQLGLVPAVISPYLISSLGARRALVSMLTAETLSANQAYESGLVTELCDSNDALQQQAAQRIEQLLLAEPNALVCCKQLMHQYHPLPDNLTETTAALLANIRNSPPAREGVSAFLAKRPPNWCNTD